MDMMEARESILCTGLVKAYREWCDAGKPLRDDAELERDRRRCAESRAAVGAGAYDEYDRSVHEALAEIADPERAAG